MEFSRKEQHDANLQKLGIRWKTFVVFLSLVRALEVGSRSGLGGHYSAAAILLRVAMNLKPARER